ncbi:LEPR-XLL domain-containing protein, partial [Thermodesulfobacteriota bacterium]
MGLLRKIRRMSKRWEATAAKTNRRKAVIEPLEPRLLLSADFAAGATDALADGLDLFDNHLDSFLGGEDLLGERVPMLATVEIDDDGNMTYEAPTIDDLFTVPVDANGDGEINPFTFPLDNSDDDESILSILDTDTEGSPGYGQVDVGEFLEGWFFDPATDWLHDVGLGYRTDDFTDFLKGNVFNNLDQHLSDLSGIYVIDFEIIDAMVWDFTQDPDAQVSFSVGFELSITQSLPIDLGLEADALKLQPFTGSPYEAELPTVPVTSTLNFGFDFGVLTGGQTPGEIDAYDFFIRKADTLALNVTAGDTGMDFNLNIGFLGAEVVDGSLDMEANVNAYLRDPDDPNVLGLYDSQSGVEHTDGTITGAHLTDPDLAHEAGFFLRIGNIGINTPVTVADNDRTIFDDGNRTNTNDLLDDVNAGLEAAGLDGVVSAAFGGNQLTFSLPDVDPTKIGFDNEVIGNGSMEANSLSSILGYPTPQDVSFLLSVDGAIPKKLEFTVNPNTFVSDPTPSQPNSGDEIYVISTADILTALNGALTAAFGSSVTASDGDSDHYIELSASGKSLEISKTLTLDAGVTYGELDGYDPEDLFFASKGAASHVDLNLPIRVFPGLKNPLTGLDWNPEDVIIRGSFSPFDSDSAVAEYNETEHRFDLNFEYYPTIDNQDTYVDPSTVTSPSDEIQLINMAELLNFNLITSESMIGLLTGLGTALQQMADSGLFATYDIPSADASWSDLLNYSDPDTVAFSGLIDVGLIYDTKGDGIDAWDAAVNDEDKLLRRIVDGEEVYLLPIFVTAQGIDDAGNYGLALA